MGGSGSKNYFSGSSAPPKKPSSGSGSSGGEGSAGGSGGGSSSDACNIKSTGTLRSPNPAIVQSLAVDDVLAVQAVPVNGLDVLQALAAASEVVGVVDTPDEQALLDCIDVGNEYIATVIRISGGAITVRITRI